MRVALIAAIVTHIAVACLVLSLRTPPIVEAQTTIPINISVPITVQQVTQAPTPPQAPVEPVARPTCPPPNTDTPPAALVEPPRDVNHVFASHTNASWIAAWDEEHLVVSTDGGETFSRVLDGPGKIEDVTFDCFGRVIALRGGGVGIRDDAREAWRPVPGLDKGEGGTLLGGGPDVLVVGRSDAGYGVRLAATSDLGATWWFRDLADYAEISRTIGYQASDGSIQLMLTAPDCDSEPSYWLRVVDGTVYKEYLGYVDYGHAALDGDRFYAESDGEVRYKHFLNGLWHLTKSKRARKLLRGSVDAAGRVWSIDDTNDGAAGWAIVAD